MLNVGDPLRTFFLNSSDIVAQKVNRADYDTITIVKFVETVNCKAFCFCILDLSIKIIKNFVRISFVFQTSRCKVFHFTFFKCTGFY